MDNKTVNIDIILNSMNDVIEKFNDNKLSNKLSEYIYNECFGTPLKHSINLNIICNFKISKQEKEKITNMIRHNYGIHIREHLIYLKYDKIRASYLFFIGVMLISISRIINNINDFILGEILLIVGWVTIWESTYNFIFHDGKRRIEIKRLRKLTKCKINFKE